MGGAEAGAPGSRGGASSLSRSSSVENKMCSVALAGAAGLKKRTVSCCKSSPAPAVRTAVAGFERFKRVIIDVVS
ncbi:hypothetical protein SRHO_G00033300 [Serrasalmus rhombeus]